MPIEGEWYTTTFRQAIVCWADGNGNANRSLELPQELANTAGSDRHASTERRPIRFAGVMLQYFSSVLALDNKQPEGQKADYIEYVRFTPEGKTHKGQEFLDDFTFRAISRSMPTDKPVVHPYVLYHGPVKVRLLKQLEGDQAVPEATVDRYRDDLALRMQTDSNFPNWFGRVSNFLWWTDIIIAFTNLIHSLLGLLSQVVPNLGVCIILITFLVRGLLHPFSRRQMINAKVMQAKQEKLAPDLKKLQEKYGDDYNRLNAEKMKLYREHGINPSAMMGGCLLLLLQMPVFMGLYYALQESVFFRLEPFLWMPNLAAPDMLVRWGESIPWVSTPGDLGTWLYLGPYFNILPLIAVALMLYVQMKMMPKSEDPQVQMQQKMMKFMMILMLFFFYKSPSGLAIYFICSSLWGMVERRLIPKNIAELEEKRKAKKAAEAAARGEEPEAPKGWLGTKMAGWRAKWEQILEEAQKQQQIQRGEGPDRSAPQPPRATGPNVATQGGAGGKKKKRKR
jgi:YidC/Oxa1 family membrane protein insertase